MAKQIKENTFRRNKLSKTGGRRRALEGERRIASQVSKGGRNDLQPALEVKRVAVGLLRVSPHRARHTTPEQLERVISSISTFGFSQPILIRGQEIIDGAVRLEAASRLGMDEVPAIDCSHLDELEVRELRLALNRVAELGEWDLDLLKIEFQELIDLDADLSATGFSAEDQDIVLLDPVDLTADEQQQPESDLAPGLVSEIGDLWELDGHRLICGDCRETETLKVLLKGEQAHAVLSDPPYNVKIQGNVSGLGKKVHEEFAMASGELNDEEWQTFLDTTVSQLAGCLVPGSVLFLFMDWRSIHRLYAAGFACGLKQLNLAVWYKEAGGMGALYRSAHELVVVFCKGEKPHTNNVELGRHGRDRANVWCAPGANRRGSSANAMLSAHATPKPVELCTEAILDVTSRGQIVLDGFLGSGTTLIAAEKTGRRCFAVEYEPRFVDVAVRRWMQLTGEQAILSQTGETFDEVMARRLDAGEPEPRAANA